jgi:hypothetical protein
MADFTDDEGINGTNGATEGMPSGGLADVFPGGASWG